MAKKISLEEYKKLKPEKKNKLLLPLEILIALFGISIIVIVVLAKNNFELKDEIKKEKNKPEPITGDIYTSEELEKDMKLEFYDDNIVFVIDGYGDYYYTYDCMMEKVGDSDYSYAAFNKAAAIGKGYREGGC